MEVMSKHAVCAIVKCRISPERIKLICVIVFYGHSPNRTTVQVKTHAQVELKKLDGGFNIFEELDDYLQEENGEADALEEDASSSGEENFKENLEPKTPRHRFKGKTKRLCYIRETKKPARSPATPIASNRSASSYSAVVAPSSMLAFSSSSSITTTTLTASSLARLPHRHLSRARIALHPLLAPSRGFLSTMLPISYPGVEGASFQFSGIRHPTASLESSFLAPSPKGSGFGAFEAANTLLGLSAASKGGTRNDERIRDFDVAS
jgi:hypothetical protein